MTRAASRNWLRDNSLSIALATLFLVSIVGQLFSGHAAENKERLEEGVETLSLAAYFDSGAFLSSVFENWESEFLQMWTFVVLTAYLYQRGSPESRDPDGEEPRVGEEPGVKRPFGRLLYAHSLGLVLLVLFIASFALHWLNSTRHASEEAARKGQAAPSMLDHLGDPELWFESFQNWQSEFMSTAVLIVLGIFLRESRSTESKAVSDPNAKTGS
jgi:hypothetical protein